MKNEIHVLPFWIRKKHIPIEGNIRGIPVGTDLTLFRGCKPLVLTLILACILVSIYYCMFSAPQEGEEVKWDPDFYRDIFTTFNPFEHEELKSNCQFQHDQQILPTLTPTLGKMASLIGQFAIGNGRQPRRGEGKEDKIIR